MTNARTFLNGTKELGADMLLLYNESVETGKREPVMESAMAQEIEESDKSLDLDKTLKMEQKPTQEMEDRIQLSVNEALQQMKKLCRCCFEICHSIIKWDVRWRQGKVKQDRGLQLSNKLYNARDSRGSREVTEWEICANEREVVRRLELSWSKPENWAIATTGNTW